MMNVKHDDNDQRTMDTYNCEGFIHERRWNEWFGTFNELEIYVEGMIEFNC